jgi:hypothetical protein
MGCRTRCILHGYLALGQVRFPILSDNRLTTAVMYSYMWCFFVQLHAYVATGDARPLDLMQMVDKSMQGWAAWEPAVSNDLALRTKVSQMPRTRPTFLGLLAREYAHCGRSRQSSQAPWSHILI